MNAKTGMDVPRRAAPILSLACAVFACGGLLMADIAEAQRRGGGGRGAMARSSISGAGRSRQSMSRGSYGGGRSGQSMSRGNYGGGRATSRPAPAPPPVRGGGWSGNRGSAGDLGGGNRASTGNLGGGNRGNAGDRVSTGDLNAGNRFNAGNRVNTGDVNRGNRVNAGDINSGNRINTRDVNFDRDVNVDVDNGRWGGWSDVDVDIDGGRGDWDIDVDVDHYRPLAAAAVIGTTAAIVGTYYTSVPVGCPIVHTYTMPYYYCGGVYYEQRMYGDSLAYMVVTP